MAGTTGPATGEVTAAPGTDDEESKYYNPARPITVYDAVAGRAGLNGFLTSEQRDSDNVLPITPQEVLQGRSTVPEELLHDSYDAAGSLPASTKLPDSDTMKAIHAYASEYYSAAVAEDGKFDFKSLDETALIAVGILLEEAVREALGQAGDMAFVEPEGLEHGLEESNLTRYQVKGRVKTVKRVEVESDEDAQRDEESPAKKQRQ